jgi:hypothetical protein
VLKSGPLIGSQSLVPSVALSPLSGEVKDIQVSQPLYRGQLVQTHWQLLLCDIKDCWGRNSQLEIGDDVCNTGSRLWAEIQAIYLIWVTWGGLQPMGEEG